MSLNIRSVIRWSARASALLLAIGFLILALGEPLEYPKSLSFRAGAGMVLLFGAVTAMLLAWKWELTGALLSLFALGAFTAVVHINRYDVLVIATIPNVLFLVDWTLRHWQVKPLAKAR